jgi:flagellum-specific peptidoglycan hydrolase FlgJ
MDNKQEAIPNEDDSAERMKILNSILDEIVKLKITTKNYENALYKREQVQEAAQVEKFTEEAPATKEGQSEESGDKAGPLDELEKNPAIKKLTDFANNIISILRPALLTLVAFAPVLIALIKKAVPFIKELPSMIYDKMKEALDFLGPIFKEYIVDPVHKFFTINLPAAWDVLSMVIGDAITNLLYFPLTVINQIKQFAEEIQINALTSFIDFVKTSKLLSWLGIDVTAVTEGAEKMVGAATTRKEGLQKEQQARDEEKAGIANTSYTDQYNKGVAQRTEPAKSAAGSSAGTPVTPVKEGEVKPGSNGKFSNPDDFAKALFPYAKYVSESLGGKVPPIAFLGQWAGESGSGTSMPADFNYAGIKAFGKFKKGGFVLTEEQYTDAQLKKAQQSGESLYRVLERDTKMDKKGKKATVDEWFGKGSFDKAESAGKHWVQVKSYFAKFDDLQDFADGYLSVLKNPRYKKAIESGSAAEFGLQVAKAGYATNSAEKYSEHIASYEKQYGSKIGEEASGQMVAQAGTGSEIDKASMAAKIEEPGATTTIVNAQASAQGPVDVTPDKTSKNKPNSTAIQNAYHAHLGVALTG